eukprot:3413443-Pyramimonas_sp.AAC.1
MGRHCSVGPGLLEAAAAEEDSEPRPGRLPGGALTLGHPRKASWQAPSSGARKHGSAIHGFGA